MEKLAEHKSAVESITMQQLEESIAKAQQVETMMEQKLAKLQQDWECRGDEENSKQQQEVREIEQHDPKFATVMDSFDNVVAEHEKENLAVRRLIWQEQAEKAALEQQMRALQRDGELEKERYEKQQQFLQKIHREQERLMGHVTTRSGSREPDVTNDRQQRYVRYAVSTSRSPRPETLVEHSDGTNT